MSPQTEKEWWKDKKYYVQPFLPVRAVRFPDISMIVEEASQRAILKRDEEIIALLIRWQGTGEANYWSSAMLISKILEKMGALTPSDGKIIMALSPKE